MNEQEARKELSTALAGFRRLQGEVASLNEASNSASEVEQATREELVGLEAKASQAARASVEGNTALVADNDLESKIAMCRRRVASADEVIAENAEAVRALQPQVSAAGEKVRWLAKAVLECEGQALLDHYESVQREALTLRWKIEKLSAHLTKTRGPGENQRFPAFDAPHRLIDRLRDAVFMDEWQRWPVAEFEQAWAAFEQALQTDPDATVPDVAVKRTGA